MRCGYHGLLFNGEGRCVEIPGQAQIPKIACVRSYPVQERDSIVWIWMGSSAESQPTSEAPAYRWHSEPGYTFKGDVYHYAAPYQLIHDNLLDLSHLGYVHLKTIGGNARVHMNAAMTVEDGPDWVRAVRHMPNSDPPPTYSQAWPFAGKIDRWQEIEFRISHFHIWTGGMDAGSGSLTDPDRYGFHLRGFHGITPETESSAFYFWTVASNSEKPEIGEKVYRDSAATFDEDKVVIEQQWANMQRFPGAPMLTIHVDQPLNRARRILSRMTGGASAANSL